MTKHFTRLKRRTALTSAALLITAGGAWADIIHADDTIINGGSLCVGTDCVNGENFGSDTIRLKENNLRIHVQDTSNSASFPTNDWRLVFNDSTNGGADRFSVEDVTGGRTPFTVEAGARTNALYVDDGGRLGIGTASPATNVQVVTGNTPTLRLEQNGTSGFTAQSWDIAGNEAGFFVRDVTNGSQLPFRIIPGADSQSLVIGANNDVGIGAGTSPDASLHVLRTNGTAKVRVEETSATVSGRRLLELENNGAVIFALRDLSSADGNWSMQSQNNEFRITNGAVAGVEAAFDINGNLTLLGGLVTGTAGSCTAGSPCDGVFDPEVYQVPSIEEYGAAMWANKHLPTVGPTLPGQKLDVTGKLLKMLNALEHAHIYIQELHGQIGALEERLAAIEADKG